MKQQQFLNLASAEEAEERFWQAVQPGPLGEKLIPLADARERILSRNVIAKHNVPYFDRSNFDGFAVRAEDTFGAHETAPVSLKLNQEVLAAELFRKNQSLRVLRQPLLLAELCRAVQMLW